MATIVSAVVEPKNLDPSRSEVAFGSRAMPKLNRELADKDTKVQLCALMSLNDLVHAPARVQEAVNVGIIPTAQVLLVSTTDNRIKEKAAEFMWQIAGHAAGRSAILKHALVPSLASLFEDPLEVVRKHVLSTLERLTTGYAGVEAIVSAGLIPVLVKKADAETDAVKELVLDLLHNCLKFETAVALQTDAMTVLKNLLSHAADSVRFRAARDIADLTVPLAGKQQAVELSVLEPLCSLLASSSDHHHADTLEAAASAISSIAITTPGKLSAVDLGACEGIARLLNSADERVILASLKAITVLAEAPKGREAFASAVTRIEALIQYQGSRLDCTAVARSARTAFETVTWRP